MTDVLDSSMALEIVDAIDLLKRPLEPPAFLVRYLVPEASVTLLSGDTGSAKTAFALHLAAAIAAHAPVAARFPTAPNCGPVLFLNGEMTPALVARYLHEAISGIEAVFERGRLIFEGVDGVATFKFADETRTLLEELVAKIQPSLVVLDTQRALLIDDENDTPEVRRVFTWLRSKIVNEYGAAVLVCHHLRKIGQVSNTDRERVSGSRDILASVDVHLSAISRGEMPMHAIKLGKTRFPIDGVAAGSEWPIDARLEYGEGRQPNRSIFIAGEIGDVPNVAVRVDEATTALLALFQVGDPISRQDANATSGNPKRAWDKLFERHAIVCVGKRGRQKLYTLAELADPEPGQADPTPDLATSEPLRCKGSNRVNGRTGSEPVGSPEATTAQRASSAAGAEPREPVQGQFPIGNRNRDPIRNGKATALS